MHLVFARGSSPIWTSRRGARCIAALACAVASSSQLLAQRYSLDPLSPEVGAAPFFFSAADVLITPGGQAPQVHIPAASLGLIAADNVDALSDGTDPMPPCVVAGVVLMQFSVDRAAIGSPASAVRVQTLGNGAAGDTFQLVSAPPPLPPCTFAPPTIRRDATSFGLTPNPPPPFEVESDIDALMRSPSGIDAVNWDVYFSVDPPTAARLTAVPGNPVITEADILYASNTEPWLHIYATRAQLRLVAGDDIDGLVILDTSPGVFNATEIIHISLTAGSPSAAALGGGASMILVYPALGPGGTSVVELGNGTFDVAANEEVDALMAGDPPAPPGGGGGGVPTLPEWGLIWLALALTGLATLALRAPRFAIEGGATSVAWLGPHAWRPRLYWACLLGVSVLGGMAASIAAATGALGQADLIGGALAAPLAAYVVHLWLSERS